MIRGSIESPQGVTPFTSVTLTANGFRLSGKVVDNQMGGTVDALQVTGNFTSPRAL
jgi:hypothetical protein